MSHEPPLLTKSPLIGHAAPVRPPADRHWHAFHNDSAFTVWILSEDGVSFKASRYRLTSRTLLLASRRPPSPLLNEITALNLKYPAAVIAIFLDMVHSEHPLKIDGITHSTARSLYSLTAHAHCSAELIEQSRQLLYVSSRQCPLDLLLFASSQNDIEIGRDALMLIHERQRVESGFPLAQDWKRCFEQLEPLWALELGRLINLETEANPAEQCNWLNVRAEFDPTYDHLASLLPYASPPEVVWRLD
ncbi:hypothetical protein I317_01002 [Kwoniella heveanensis CBS 569]|nr:hypothetical protein I317_01002 [Kwoniella heveanensis CBS 569]